MINTSTTKMITLDLEDVGFLRSLLMHARDDAEKGRREYLLEHPEAREGSFIPRMHTAYLTYISSIEEQLAAAEEVPAPGYEPAPSEPHTPEDSACIPPPRPVSRQEHSEAWHAARTPRE